MAPRTIHNIGFLYCCGHRCASVGSAATKFYVELQSRGLAPASPDMNRPIDTVCGACWEVPDDGQLLARRSQVLRTVLTKEQSHSLIVMLYRLADRLLADDTRAVHIALLACWAARVASEYPPEHLDAFVAAVQSRPVGSTIPRLVVDDALLSIRTWRAPSDTPLAYRPEACVCTYHHAVERFDRRARRLRWSVWRPGPVVVGPLLTDIARAGVRFAAQFQADRTRVLRSAHGDDDATRFPAPNDPVPAEHERRLADDAVHGFKAACYALFRDATEHPTAATRDELRAVGRSVRFLDSLLGRVVRLKGATLRRCGAWCGHERK